MLEERRTIVEGLSDARMHEEVEEVSDKICNDWEIAFLEGISVRAHENRLSNRQREVLEKIWERACASPY